MLHLAYPRSAGWLDQPINRLGIYEFFRISYILVGWLAGRANQPTRIRQSEDIWIASCPQVPSLRGSFRGRSDGAHKGILLGETSASLSYYCHWLLNQNHPRCWFRTTLALLRTADSGLGKAPGVAAILRDEFRLQSIIIAGYPLKSVKIYPVPAKKLPGSSGRCPAFLDRHGVVTKFLW